MSLVVVCPSDWRAISNGMEQRFDYFDNRQGKHVIERNKIDWFLDFYGQNDDIVVNEFE